MKLRELKLKNFGKFHDKSIQLQDGINVICGENESGKTTMHTFIKAMLFGLERGRGRASAKDTFSRYEPWEYGNYYSGELKAMRKIFVCKEILINIPRALSYIVKRMAKNYLPRMETWRWCWMD